MSKEVPPKRFISRVLVAVGIVISVTVAVALASGGDAEPAVPGPSPRAEAVDGAMSDSPRAGEAVFRAAGLGPGDTIDGTVLVTNEGTSQGMFWLSRKSFSDRRGPAGGTLSERLQVSVLDVTAPEEPMLVYTGAVMDMGARPLGFVAPGKSRIYSVGATLLPDAAPRVSNAADPYEGSSTTISLEWRAIAGEPPAASSTDEPEVRETDERAPSLRLDIPPRQRMLETGRLVVNVRCDEACRLDAGARLRGVDAPSPAAGAPRRAQRGDAAALRVAFGPVARKAMREALTAGRSVPVELTVTARDEAGNQAGATRKIWLRPGS